MQLRSLLFIASVATFAFGCAASSSNDSTEESASGSEDALTGSPERAAQLEALRARVGVDFESINGSPKFKLVFVVRRLNSDATSAAIQAHIMKRERATGKDSELTDADFAASAYAADIREGLFDGPEVTAVLKKNNGKWAIATRQVADEDATDAGDGGDAAARRTTTEEAYVVGPTDVAYWSWDVDYGVKRSWLGL